MEERPLMWSVAANILNKQLRTAETGSPPAWALDEVLITPHRKNVSCYEPFTKLQDKDGWRTFVNAAVNHQIAQNAGNFLTRLELVGFSRGTVLHGVSKQASKLKFSIVAFMYAEIFPICLRQ
jgi:hypothetical protein